MCGQKSTVSAAVYILFVITPSGLSRSSDFPSLSPSRTPAPTLQGLGGVFGSLTQLRRAWVPPWTQPLPLGASVCCQARGCGLREVDVCTARSHPGCPLCPSSALNLPCQASRQGSVHERGGLNQTGDSPCSDTGPTSQGRRWGQDVRKSLCFAA